MDSVELQQSVQGGKRKRSLSDDGPLAQPPPPPPQPSTAVPVAQGNVTQINYFNKARSDKLRLIEGDSDVFNDILNQIADYDGVLERHESIAANLGAKLVGPLLVKSVEKLFEGPIKILQSQYDSEAISITWLDVIEYAGTQPNSFMLNDTSSGGRVCQFWIKDCLVEISEDDYRLVLSGAPERMIPSEPVAEDEVAEVGALEIVEQRLNALVKKADLVAGHARQLRHRLKSRKTAIQARRPGRPAELYSASSFGIDGRQPSIPFQAVSHRNSNGDNQVLHENLLRQFQNEGHKPMSSLTKGKGARRPSDSTSPITPSHPTSKKNLPGSSRNAHSSGGGRGPNQIVGGQHRPAMMARMEILARGDPIWPPCDRCRRLRIDCTKYLTACAGCTRKHAKCSWYSVTPEEVAWIVGGFEGELPVSALIAGGDEDGVGHGEDHGIGNGNGAQYGHLVGGGSSAAQDLVDPDANLHPDLRSGGAAAVAAAAVGGGGGDVLLLHDQQHQHQQLGNGYAQQQHSVQRRANTNGEVSSAGASNGTGSNGTRRSASSTGSTAAATGRNHSRASAASGGILLRGSRASRNADTGGSNNASASAGGSSELYLGQMGGAAAMDNGSEAAQQKQHQHR